MKLICIRHLPTQWNKKQLLQGRHDIDILPPDEQYRQAIDSNRSRLKSYGSFECVLTSTLKRTQQTAVCYHIHHITIEPLLNEIDFGTYVGQPKASLLKDWGEVWQQNPRNLVLGEPIINLEDRINTFIAKYQAYSQLLVFGHGGWIRGLLSIVQYGDIRAMNQFVVENNQLYEFAFSGK